MGLRSGAPNPLAVGSGVGEGKESDAREQALRSHSPFCVRPLNTIRGTQRSDGRQPGGGNGVLEAFADCREGANEALGIENGGVAGKKL
jgi:hypothetical protein